MKKSAKNFTKDEFISALEEIKEMGWIRNRRPGNDGGAGNTLEDLLGIKENNLPIADTAKWELKTQKTRDNYITLFHMDPYPREANLITAVLLPKYGWKHKTIPNEMSFRATLSAIKSTDRGLIVRVDRKNQKVLISFDYTKVGTKHSTWLQGIIATVGNGEFITQPYWSFEVLKEKVEKKIKNSFFIGVKKRGPKGAEEFLFDEVWLLERVSFDLFIDAIENGDVLIDFDARTHHNHGTKFRTADTDSIKKLYRKVEQVI